MALANKYKTTYCDVYGRTCEAFILQEGYVGAVTELDAQTTPFTISYDAGSDFKFEPIRASSASLNLVLGNGVDLAEFWTQNEREYQIAHYISGVLDWIGWVIPNGFSYQLTGGLYYAELEATDGLETLDAAKFWNESTSSNYGIDDLGAYHTRQQFDLIFVLTECLKKISLGLDIWVAVDVYEQNMTKDVDTRAGCPLTQANVNVRTYIGDSDKDDIPYWRDTDEAFNSLEVLTNLCYMFGAKVYQSQGVWRFKRVNVDIDYGTGATTRYWYKFDEDAAYIIGRVAVADQKAIDCMDTATGTGMIEDNHFLSMDEIYKRFRVNYKYTYARRGDSDINLIKNGDFTGFWDNTTPESAPYKWERWRIGNKWRPKLSLVDIPAGEQPLINGNTKGIEFGVQPVGFDFSNLDPYAAIWAGLRNSGAISVKKGDELYLTFYVKMACQYGQYRTAFMISLRLGTDEGIYLGSNSASFELEKRNEIQWNESNGDDYLFFPCSAQQSVNWKEFNDNTLSTQTIQWVPFDLKIAKIPANGNLNITFHGMAWARGASTENFPAFQTIQQGGDDSGQPTDYYRPMRYWSDPGLSAYRAILAGVACEIVPSPAERDKSAYYVHDNPDQTYSLQKKPIEVWHGDTIQQYTISQITVPANGNVYTQNLWDVIDDSYGLSSLGLTQARSIMQLYSKPNKIMEGIVQVPDAEIDAVYTFDAIGTERFILQRGTLNRKQGYIEGGVWIEISDETIVTEDSSDNGVDPNAIWVQWGAFPTRCIKDGSGNNTGELEIQEVDSNPNSSTYFDIRWTATGITDTDLCPIGSTPKYYIGHDKDVTLTEALAIERLPEIDDTDPALYWFLVKNLGYDYELLPTQVETLNYIYFLHLPSAGTVDEVSTTFQPDVTEDWGYIADMTVGGVTYNVLRSNYPLAKFKTDIGFKFI